MARLANWQNNLSKLIEHNRCKPFKIRSHNCLMWAGLGIKAVTGTNPVAHHKGKYLNEIGAAKFLRTIDKVKTPQEFLQNLLGELQPVAFARHGDIVFANSDLISPADVDLFGPVPGVCYGSTSYFLGEHGLIEFETLRLGQALWVS